MKKIFIQKNFNNFVGTPVDSGQLFATGVFDTGGKLPPVSTTIVKLVAKFAAGVVDTGGQHLAENISANFRKNSKRP
jgi:hypothetical protein